MKLSQLTRNGALGVLLFLGCAAWAGGADTPRARRAEKVLGTSEGVPGLELASPQAQLPDDVQRLVEQFRTQAGVFVARQKELNQQIKGATAQQREQLKEQLKSNRERFLEDTRQVRVEIRERVRELRDTLKENRPINAGIGEHGARGRRGDD